MTGVSNAGASRWSCLSPFLVAYSRAIGSCLWLFHWSLILAGFLYKLNQLHTWLIKGAKPSLLPDSNGIWERITQQIQNTHKKSDRRKDRMANLLKRLQGIITALPYATVVLNGNNEIDWANGISQVYLNVDIKKDRGQRYR